MSALADRVREELVDDIRLYYYHAEAPMRDSLLRYELMDRIHPYTFFVQEPERPDPARAGRRRTQGCLLRALLVRAVHPCVSRQYPRRHVLGHGLPDGRARLLHLRHKQRLHLHRRPPSHAAGRRGQSQHATGFRELQHPRVRDRAIVEHTSDLPVLSPRPATKEERLIGTTIAKLVPEHATLQIDVGGLPNAVCEALVDREDLGIHSEALGPGLAALMDSGAASGSRKNIDQRKAVFTFAMGDEQFYAWMNENQAIESRPVDYVNDPAVIAHNDNVVSINSTVEMDLTGAANSEYLAGHQFSASGGQLDFIRGAYASHGGMSFMAFQSTAKNGSISKIVPRLSGPVTTPRNDIEYVVTEHGVVNLRGKSSTERAEALIGLAHPSHRDQLASAAHDLHLT